MGIVNFNGVVRQKEEYYFSYLFFLFLGLIPDTRYFVKIKEKEYNYEDVPKKL